MVPPEDGAKLYEEAGQAWRHFASWREKTFAGYLTALAALAIGFTQHTSAPARFFILGGATLVSFVFWVFEYRSNELINACQLAADRLEGGKGCYAELNRRHGEGAGYLTYGFAVGALVSGVVAAALAGSYVYGVAWYQGKASSTWPSWLPLLAGGLFVALTWILRWVAKRSAALLGKSPDGSHAAEDGKGHSGSE